MPLLWIQRGAMSTVVATVLRILAVQWLVVYQRQMIEAMTVDPIKPSSGARSTGPPPTMIDRRSCLASAVGGIVSSVVVGAGSSNCESAGGGIIARAIDMETTIPSTMTTFQVYPDDSAALRPKLQLLNNDDFLDQLSSIPHGAIWLGEHHNSDPDHRIQAKLLRQIANRRRQSTSTTTSSSSSSSTTSIALGLEQVQVKFQSVLDAYNGGQISMDEMRMGVEWDSRWIWPFATYQTVFETARELGIPLVALNVNSEDSTLVEKGGLPSLPLERLHEYIRDAPGFAAFTLQPQFRAYVDYVISPSYQLHREMGLLQYTMTGEKLDELMPFRNFLSGRILWDEAMASNAYEWTRKHEGSLLIGIVGADHVKFNNGIPGRYSRIANNDENRDGNVECVSVMLNPTLIDTLPPGTSGNTEAAMSSNTPDNILLQLRFVKDNVARSARSLPESTGGVLPLADYLVVGQ